MGVAPHLGCDLARQRPYLFDMLAGHPKLHRIAHRRAVFQTRHPRAYRRELFIERVDQPGAQAFPVLDGLGQHHKLGKARRGQLLIQWQVIAGRTGACVSHIVLDARVILEQCLELLDLVGGVAQRSTLGQLHIDHQLQSAGRREELLRNKLEQHHRAYKHQRGQGNHGFAPGHTPLHQPTYALVKWRCIGVRHASPCAVFGRMNLRQVR